MGPVSSDMYWSFQQCQVLIILIPPVIWRDDYEEPGGKLENSRLTLTSVMQSELFMCPEQVEPIQLYMQHGKKNVF